MYIEIKKLSERVETIENENDLMRVLEDIVIEHTRLAKENFSASDDRKKQIESKVRVLKKAERFLKSKLDNEEYNIGSILDI